MKKQFSKAVSFNICYQKTESKENLKIFVCSNPFSGQNAIMLSI